MDNSISGGRRRIGAWKEWHLSRIAIIGLMTSISARRRGSSDSSCLRRSSRGCTRLSTAIISSYTCDIVILSMRPGEHHERRRVVISTVGQ